MSIARVDSKRETPQRVSARRWRFPRAAFLISLLALVGVLVLLYPTTAAWFSQYNQSRVIEMVGGAVQKGPSSRLEAEIERARDYNDALVGGALVEPNTSVPTGTGASGSADAYESLLRADAEGAMARLRIPAIGVDLPIYHGTSEQTLQRGVGHLQGTSLPVGGASQHSVLTAHRGLASAELFTQLDKVGVGDTFTIEVFGEVLTYRVRDTRVVDPDQTESLYPSYGEDLVTLVTCTPLGINTHRILVTGERVTPTPIADVERAGDRPDIPGFPWWAVGLGATLLLLSAYVWRAGATRRSEQTDFTRDDPGGVPTRA